ncbi:MAG: hypothetical protein Q4C59_11270 [Lachnospiraceae bacterium]|nr:hypothetical protein [Lachnospiraceae bacterium]
MKKLQVSAMLALMLAGSMAFTGLAEETELETEAEVTAGETADAALEEETQEAVSESGSSQVADASEMTVQQDVVEDGMVPIYGSDLVDGVYPVEVASSSSMFKVVDCELTVQDGEMTAIMTMSGDGYLKLFMGTGAEAVQASEEDYIPFVENAEGKQTYEVPVEALDMGMDCAAWSKRKEKWYDRVLVFKSSSLPQNAFTNLEITTAESLELADGTYQAEVMLEGGSGKASVESPAVLEVKDGKVTATIIWSSKNYDYMLVDGEKYEMLETDGNSTFEIPVSGFDWKMPIVADTIAMSTPHEIDYTLYFDSSTLVQED